MTSLIFLAGGQGRRFAASTPKQYLSLCNKKIFDYSFEIFQKSPLISEIIVVCAPAYQHLFPENVQFAIPGKRRQDSVYSGLLKTTQEIVLAHDSARPFVEENYLSPLLEAIKRTGSAALGCPVTSTIKQCSPNRIVEQTIDRSTLWEIQTPQGMKRDLFFECFDHVHKNALDVTDELSMCEHLKKLSEIVPSSPRNFKITTPFDLTVAETLCAIK